MAGNKQLMNLLGIGVFLIGAYELYQNVPQMAFFGVMLSVIGFGSVKSLIKL